jgi:hypothetical protein
MGIRNTLSNIHILTLFFVGWNFHQIYIGYTYFVETHEYQSIKNSSVLRICFSHYSFVKFNMIPNTTLSVCLVSYIITVVTHLACSS